MNTDEYLNMLINKRVMRYTYNASLLENIYSIKYKKWLQAYCNEYKIYEVPLQLCCNTLQRLPKTFKIQDKYFFVMDYYFFDFLYDMNYILCEEGKSDYLVNLVIKVYIEALFQQNKIDNAYFLAVTSPTVDEYKDVFYREYNIQNYWVEHTDIQEEFAFLHEANHFLLHKNKLQSSLMEYDAILKTFFSGIFDKNERTYKDLLTECCCDCQSIRYMLTHFENKDGVELEDYISMLYKVPVWLYTLEYINEAATDHSNLVQNDSEILLFLTARMGIMYYIISEQLTDSTLIQINAQLFEEHVTLLKDLIKKIRQIIIYTDEIIEENMKNAECGGCSSSEKIYFLEEYLCLLK